MAKQNALKHGQSWPPTKTYRSWLTMMTRCNNPKFPRYRDYGGRGISVCQEWHKFQAFFEDMGNRPEGKTLDRINNDGNYEPGNCRWATPLEQRHNCRPKRPYVKRNAKGYYLIKRLNKFTSYVSWHGQLYYLGLFESANLAKIARNKKIATLSATQ